MKKVYLASPFFNPEQIERIEYIEKLLEKIGFEVYSPRKDCSYKLTPTSSNEEREAVFADNIRHIEHSDLVLAVTDGKDMGTIFEAGYAYGVDVPILYFAETLGTNLFNLMLAESALLGTYTSREQLEEILVLIKHNDILDCIDTVRDENGKARLIIE